ncbi:unnamed protein product, partial [marine sediment metagenome]
ALTTEAMMSDRGLARLGFLAALLAPGCGSLSQIDASGESDPVLQAISLLGDRSLEGRHAPCVVNAIATIRSSRDPSGLTALVERITFCAPGSPGEPRLSGSY